MNLAHIELSNLSISPANMRAKHRNRDVADLIPSVEARGVLVPLLVRPNGEPGAYEIIAGRRRYLAAKAIAERRHETISLPCAIVEAGDDVAALEASLIENVARVDADEVTQWETYSRLARQGRGIDQIAATFGLAEAVVRRVLALGNLQPRIRALYRSEKIDAGTVRLLTMATSAQQREWLALYESPEEHVPTGRQLKAWLFGGETISTSAALFDLVDYSAPIVSDLFGEESYFTDTAAFWSLQEAAIGCLREGLLSIGWADVVVLDRGRWFERWAYDKRDRATGGRVYITVSAQGAVEVHEGFVTRKEASGRDTGISTRERPEMSAPLARYVDLHRHAVVRTELIEHFWTALRLLLAHAIAGSSLWNVRCERQRADKPDTEQSIAQCGAQLAFEVHREKAVAQLGLQSEGGSLLDEARGLSIEETFNSLLRLDDTELLGLVPIVMGETLEAGGDAVDVIGAALGVDIGAHWHADDAFFALLRDRRGLLAMLEEVAGPEVAKANSGSPAKVLRAILRDCISGTNGRARVERWAPKWLRFPSGRYLGEPMPADAEEKSALDGNDAVDEPVESIEQE